MDKVLHVLPMNKMSGAERMALLICKNLKSYEPVVVCGGQELASVFNENGIRNYNIKFSNKKLLGNAYDLSKIIKSEDIKIVHAHDNTASLLSYLAKRIFGLNIKIVSHIHSCYPFLNKNGINKKIDSILRKKYDYNIACGNLVYDFYSEKAKYFPKEKTKILSNAIDIHEITNVNLEESDKVIEEFNIPREKIILGFIGRICNIKGIVPFIKGIANYKDKFNDCKILLVGSGDQEAIVKSLIKELELESLFVLTGFQENVYKFYPIIDLFFLPSHYEGLPMVILEAMASKKIVVSMNVGSINEVIEENKTGYLIEKEKYDDFIKKLIEIKSANKERKKIGQNAFNYINKYYNIENYTKSIEDLYSNQMGG